LTIYLGVIDDISWIYHREQDKIQLSIGEHILYKILFIERHPQRWPATRLIATSLADHSLQKVALAHDWLQHLEKMAI
jgi:hypothetical protein